MKEIETEAFYQCNALTALNVPKVLKIGEKAFYGSKNLKELQLPATLETLGDSAFAVEQKNRRKLNVTSERVTPPVVTPGEKQSVCVCSEFNADCTGRGSGSVCQCRALG